MTPDPALLNQAYSAANNYGVPYDVLTSIIAGESGWNPFAYNSGSGAAGLGQTLASTARDPGYGVTPLSDPYNSTDSINFTAQYLAALYGKTGSWYAAAQSFSGSKNAVPYAGNNQQSNILAALSAADNGGVINAGGSPLGVAGNVYNPAVPTWASGAVDPTTGQLLGTGAPTVPSGSGFATSMPAASSLVDNLWAKLSSVAARGTLLVVGFILLLGALIIFAKTQES